MLKQRLNKCRDYPSIMPELNSLRIKYASPLRVVANSVSMRQMLEVALRAGR